MSDFDAVVALAAARHGGMDALEAKLAEHRSRTADAIAAIPDARILAEMTRHLFQGGFSWKVINAKWPGFEEAFEGFDVHRCAAMSEEWFDELLKDTRIIRNAAKVRAVQVNAQFLLDLAAEHGSAARFFAGWPDADFVGLLEVLKKRASRLGGETGMRFLRTLGKPAFILTQDVVTALIREGVLTKAPGGKGDMAKVQRAFNTWSAETGRDLTALSRLLAMSVESGPYH